MSVFEEFTARQRAMWGSGDWPEFQATDGSLRAEAEYLLTVARIAA